MSAEPIGMFDSGVGGLTVMREVMRAMPNENIIYVGDTARVPYGNKCADTIVRYSMENMAFLVENKIKLLVIACNTASSYALDHLQQKFGIPVIGVIDPGAAKAVQTTRNQCIGVLGTTATVQSQSYVKKIQALLPAAKVVSIACPLFVPLVEEGFIEHLSAKLIIQEYLKKMDGIEVDTLLLGCTHYPFLKDLIQQHVGEHVVIVDSAESCAESVSSALKKHLIEAPIWQEACYKYFVSDAPEKFRELGEKLFGIKFPSIEHISYS